METRKIETLEELEDEIEFTEQEIKLTKTYLIENPIKETDNFNKFVNEILDQQELKLQFLIMQKINWK